MPFPANFAAEILATLKAKAIPLLKLNNISDRALFDTYKPTLHRRCWVFNNLKYIFHLHANYHKISLAYFSSLLLVSDLWVFLLQVQKNSLPIFDIVMFRTETQSILVQKSHKKSRHIFSIQE